MVKHQQSILETLSWLQEMGVDEALEEKPVNRFDPSKRYKKPTIELVAPTEPPAQLVVPKQATKNATQASTKAETLEELKREVENFEGCFLKKTAMNTVFADGNPKASVMLVGEAPGSDEDRQGKPFVGMSGQLLDQMFAAIGLNRAESLYISNVIPWRPPGNRAPTTEEITMCLPFIKRHIELVAPKVLVLVGGTASKALSGRSEGITKLRGQELTYTSEGLKDPIRMMPIYHPAYLLRSPGRKKDAWADLLKIKEVIAGL